MFVVSVIFDTLRIKRITRRLKMERYENSSRVD